MNIFNTILFFAISCSTVCIYGIGFERSFLDSGHDAAFFSRLPSMLILSLGSFMVLWFPVTLFFIPFNMNYLVPVFTVVICVLAQYGLALTGITRSPVPGEERIFYFGIVFLSLFEGISLIHGIVILLAGFLSYILFTILLFSIRERIRSSRIPVYWKGAPISLISLALVTLAFYTPDVSWWFLGR